MSSSRVVDGTHRLSRRGGLAVETGVQCDGLSALVVLVRIGGVR